MNNSHHPLRTTQVRSRVLPEISVWRGVVRALLVFSACLAFMPTMSRAAEQKPNIVIFLVDDMGVMDTSVPFLTDERGQPRRYPLNDYYRTPNMDRLAARGIRFSNFYAMSVCSPTRISIMTGQNAARHRTTNWINPDKDNAGPNGAPDWNWMGLKADDVTLARLLQSAGYRTIHVGKGHFGPRESEGADPCNLGFDVNVGGASIGAPGSYYGEKNYGHGTPRAASAVPHLEKYHGTETFLTEALTSEAKKHLADAVEADKPFFLYLAHYAVHAPFESDPRFADHYKDSGKPAPVQAFATMIEGMDKSLGDILDHLETLGVAENTVVFFLGDNGSDAPLGHQHEVACAAPLRGKKGAHYEGGMRVPFLAAWAKPNAENSWQKRLPIATGAVQDQLAAVYDLFPTALALAGVEPPENHAVDGLRLDSLLTGQHDGGREEVFLMHYPHAPHRTDYFTCYRQGSWKVIYHYFPSEVSGNSHYQLFNLAEDPFEQQDLAGSQPEQLQRLMKGLIAALEEQQAVYPVEEDGVTPRKPHLPEEANATRRPHIVFVMADDMGWGETGYRGHPVLKTPNLDAMAASGLRFERFYAGAPVCSPTRASVLTGRANDRGGVLSHGYALRRQEKTIAQALKAAGYVTGHFGKWHLNGMMGPGVPILADDERHPGRFGFDEWVSVSNFYDLDPLMSRGGTIEQFSGDSSEVAVAEAVKFLEKHHASGQSMFAVVWYGTPHSPFRALPADKALFGPLNEASANHYGELVAMDRSIGTLRQALRRLGIADDTLLVFCSDNGGLPGITPETVGGLRGNKGSVFEGGLRVPGIIEWPAVIQPRVTQFPACTMDLFPTVVDILGLPEDSMLHPVDGMSLKPLFSVEIAERRQPIPFRFGSKAALVENDYKLVTDNLNRGVFELYDLNADPKESRDLAAEQPERLERMKKRLLAWNETVEASMAGEDYSERTVSPPDPQPQFWYDVPAYQPYLPQWLDRWEYKSYIENRNRARPGAGNQR